MSEHIYKANLESTKSEASKLRDSRKWLELKALLDSLEVKKSWYWEDADGKSNIVSPGEVRYWIDSQKSEVRCPIALDSCPLPAKTRSYAKECSTKVRDACGDPLLTQTNQADMTEEEKKDPDGPVAVSKRLEALDDAIQELPYDPLEDSHQGKMIAKSLTACRAEYRWRYPLKSLRTVQYQEDRGGIITATIPKRSNAHGTEEDCELARLKDQNALPKLDFGQSGTARCQYEYAGKDLVLDLYRFDDTNKEDGRYEKRTRRFLSAYKCKTSHKEAGKYALSKCSPEKKVVCSERLGIVDLNLTDNLD